MTVLKNQQITEVIKDIKNIFFTFKFVAVTFKCSKLNKTSQSTYMQLHTADTKRRHTRILFLPL